MFFSHTTPICSVFLLSHRLMSSRNAPLSFLLWLFICASHLCRVLALLCYSLFYCDTRPLWMEPAAEGSPTSVPQRTKLQCLLNSAFSVPGTFQQHSCSASDMQRFKLYISYIHCLGLVVQLNCMWSHRSPFSPWVV